MGCPIYAAAFSVFLNVMGLTSSSVNEVDMEDIPLKGTPNSKSLVMTLEKSSKNLSLSLAYVSTHFLNTLSYKISFKFWGMQYLDECVVRGQHHKSLGLGVFVLSWSNPFNHFSFRCLIILLPDPFLA